MEYFLFIGIVQALFTSVVLLSKRESALNDHILAVWMIFIALPMIAGAAIQMWPDLHIPILRSDLIYPLTYGPFMWLYVRAVTGEISALSRRNMVHFIPFVAISLFQFVTDWAPTPPNPEIAQFDHATRIIGGINLIIMLAYSVAVFIRLQRHGKDVIQHFSNLSNRITLLWLYWLTAAISVVSLLLYVASLLSLPDLLVFHLPAQVAIILTLSFFGLRQTQVFDYGKLPENERTEQERANAERQSAQASPQPADCQLSHQDKQSYSRSGLSDERAERIYRRLDGFMKKERPYLSADLTIADLAERLSVSRHHLTEVINTRHNKNFYAFINEYRIDAVKKAMQSPPESDMSLLDLAYAYGFNSKSPFNTAFKRCTGMTPSQYREQLSPADPVVCDDRTY